MPPSTRRAIPAFFDTMDEPQLQQRVAMLEQRMVWLEHALAHLLVKPGAPALPADLLVNLPAAGAPVTHAPDTRPRAATAPESTAAARAAVQPADQPAPAAAPQATPRSGTASTLPSITPPPAIVASAAVATRPAAPPAAAPLSATRAPLPPAARAPAAAFDLRLTGAFNTLETQVQLAADQEAAARTRRPAAPMLEINPELAATGRLLRNGPKLEVRCALEVQYPSVMQNLLKVWNTPNALAYLQRLIGQDTGGRLGVDPAVKEEVQFLHAIRSAH